MHLGSCLKWVSQFRELGRSSEVFALSAEVVVSIAVLSFE